MKESFQMERCDNPTCGGNGNCTTCPKRMLVKRNNDVFEVVTEYTISEREDISICHTQNTGNECENAYAIAIDLGTTTLVFALVDKAGDIIHTTTMLNSQRQYGLDVLSRIQASVDGKRKELQECIQRQLCGGINKLLEEYNASAKNVSASRIEHIVIAGNTTMIHLLMGYDCGTLGVYPFTPVNTELILGDAKELLGYQQQDTEIKTTFLPGISAFVGGDIIAGLYALDFVKKEEISLFVDLGTNGEIALGNGDMILTTSVAAGPAFEGGNISCGMGSVAGAIYAVEMGRNDSDLQNDDGNGNYQIATWVKTIYDAPPCGICGTGVIETVAELLKCGLIDETGLLADDYFDNGFPLSPDSKGCIAQDKQCASITLTQKDIREFQLAKAAVRTGIDMVIEKYGITADRIDKVYLAGGFGYHLNVSKAASIGLIPQELAGKTIAVGNTSLAGAVKYSMDRSGVNNIQKIKEISKTVILANDADFQEQYLKNTCLG